MDEDTLLSMKEQHINNYRNAIVEMIRNNTKVLVEDLSSYIEKPPLDSMDVVKNKLLELAKKYKIVLNSEKLDELLNTFRKTFLGCCSNIEHIRFEKLENKTRSIRNEELFELYKKDFVPINKELKKIFKDSYEESIVYLFNNINSLFSSSTDEDIQNKFKDEFTKYMNHSYQKQLLESFELRVLLKDTTLMNIIKEQGEHYLFTLNHSRVLNDIN